MRIHPVYHTGYKISAGRDDYLRQTNVSSPTRRAYPKLVFNQLAVISRERLKLIGSLFVPVCPFHEICTRLRSGYLHFILCNITVFTKNTPKLQSGPLNNYRPGLFAEWKHFLCHISIIVTWNGIYEGRLKNNLV